MKFCNNCNNILYKSTENDILKYICNTCLLEKDASPEDTLMLNISFSDNKNLLKSEIYLNIANKDPISPYINENCTKCENTIIKQICIENNGKSIYICPKCNNRFMKN